MNNKTGFSLIELLVVIIIFGGIMGALLISFLVGKSSFLSADAYIQVQQGVRTAFDNMVKEIREAGWDTTTPKNNIPPGISAITANGSQLDFQVALGYDLPTTTCPGAAGSPWCCDNDQICWGAQDSSGALKPGWSIRYSLAGGQLVRNLYDEAGALQATQQRVLANNVQNMAFTYPSANKTVKAEMEVLVSSQQLAGGSMSSGSGGNQLETTVRLRN